MKKRIYLLAVMILAPIAVYAALSNGGGMGSWKSQQDSNGDVVIKVLAVDGSGTQVPTPGSGPASASNQLTQIAIAQATQTPIATPLPVKAAAMTGSVEVTAVANQTPTYFFNVTSTASTTQSVIIDCNAVGPGSAAYIAFPAGVTYSVMINNGVSPYYIPLSITGGVSYGPFSNSSGVGIVGISTSSSNVNLKFTIHPIP